MRTTYKVTLIILLLQFAFFLPSFSQETVSADGENAGEVQIGKRGEDPKKISGKNLNKAQADSAYLSGNYHQAIHIYEQLLHHGVDTDIYYNLANAYYRLGDYPHAILYYERVLRYEPGDEDAVYNLSVCRSKASVASGHSEEMFFVTWFHRILSGHSVDTWAIGALVFLVLVLSFFIACRMLPRLWMRKTAFGLMALTFPLCVFCFFAAASRHTAFQEDKVAVLLKDAEIAPEEKGSKPQLLVAGTTVNILDESPDGKSLVECPDRILKGWIDNDGLEKL